ncbi:MAG: hypothetical protein ACR2NU_17450 [Aeoliella sp.]
MDEIAGHLDDVLSQEENKMSTDAINRSMIDGKLGTPKKLASAVHEHFNYRTFAGRHPWLMFVLSPLPLFIVIVALQCLLISGLEWLGLIQPKGWMFSLLWNSMNYIPVVVVTLWLCYCWRQSERQWTWLLSAMSCLALAVAPFAATVTISSEPGQSLIAVGVFFSDSFASYFLNAPYYLIPLAIGCVAIWLHSRQSSSSQFAH